MSSSTSVTSTEYTPRSFSEGSFSINFDLEVKRIIAKIIFSSEMLSTVTETEQGIQNSLEFINDTEEQGKDVGNVMGLHWTAPGGQGKDRETSGFTFSLLFDVFFTQQSMVLVLRVHQMLTCCLSLQSALGQDLEVPHSPLTRWIQSPRSFQELQRPCKWNPLHPPRAQFHLCLCEWKTHRTFLTKAHQGWASEHPTQKNPPKLKKPQTKPCSEQLELINFCFTEGVSYCDVSQSSFSPKSSTDLQTGPVSGLWVSYQVWF